MRIALAIEYDGSAFCGWQRQKHCHSVQAEVEAALAQIADASVTVHCAGRTDTGVHALAQIVHFDSPAKRPLRAWTFGMNSHLARSVAVHWAAEMPDDFHARFTACDRSYRYSILNRDTRPGLLASRLSWERMPLDVAAMHLAAQVLVGEHDFQSFRAAECQARHAVREIRSIAVSRHGRCVSIDVTANGFLHNMVRIITGCLIRIGRGEADAAWLRQVLLERDRTVAAKTAAPTGLCFLQPTYPKRFGVPDFVAREAVTA